MDDTRQNGGAPAWTFVAVLIALVVLVFLCGCTTVNVLPEAKGFEMAAVLAKEIATPVRWEWDAPTKDTAGNPLVDPQLTYELWVNGDVYSINDTICTVEDNGSLLVARVRASTDCETWSEWSEIAAHRFPELSIDSEGVRWQALPPLTYSLHWTPSLLSGWQVAKSGVEGNGQTESYPLQGDQGFFKLEGAL